MGECSKCTESSLISLPIAEPILPSSLYILYYLDVLYFQVSKIHQARKINLVQQFFLNNLYNNIVHYTNTSHHFTQYLLHTGILHCLCYTTLLVLDKKKKHAKSLLQQKLAMSSQ